MQQRRLVSGDVLLILALVFWFAAMIAMLISWMATPGTALENWSHYWEEFFFGYCLVMCIGSLLIFWIWMLIDCIRRDFGNETLKALWIWIVVYVIFIGAIPYYFIFKRKEL